MRGLRGLGGPLTKFVIFALITILFTLVLAATIRNQLGGSLNTYYAKFVDATQVENGDDVRIAGVRVGQVDSVSLVERKVALVTLSVQKFVRLPKDVEAIIKLRNLTGQRYIDLTPGVGPPEQFLPAGATIPLSQTHPAINLTQLFGGFRPLLQALSPNDVNQLSLELVKVLQGEAHQVDACISIGECWIEGLPPNLPKFSPIQVRCGVGSNGLIDIMALDMTSGKMARAEIHRSSGLSEHEIAREAEWLRSLKIQ